MARGEHLKKPAARHTGESRTMAVRSRRSLSSRRGAVGQQNRIHMVYVGHHLGRPVCRRHSAPNRQVHDEARDRRSRADGRRLDTRGLSERRSSNEAAERYLSTPLPSPVRAALSAPSLPLPGSPCRNFAGISPALLCSVMHLRPRAPPDSYLKTTT